MQFVTEEEQLKPQINIAPLIDVVLLLLIFFMISSSFVVNPGIKVDLPESEAGSVQTTQDIKILLAADGTVYLNGQKRTPNELFQDLQAIQNSINRKEVAQIKADSGAFHGKVVEIMDIVKRSGLEIAIATRPIEKDENE